jgi:hypothetical protein
MKYQERALKIKEIIYRVQQEKKKWKHLDDLKEYLKNYNARIKSDKKRRKGFLVSELYTAFAGLEQYNGNPVVLEIPNEWAEKIMVFSDFP